MTFTDEMKAELAKPLDRKHVKPPAPGKYGDYIEGWRVIDEANRIFGFDNWMRETVLMVETNRDLNGDKWFVGYHAKVRVIAAQHVIREGSGFGSGVSKNLGDAIESAIKEAETDAMKRALMTFGNPFGLALYDKTHANVADAPPPAASAESVQIIRDLAAKAVVAEPEICRAANVALLEALPAVMVDGIVKKLNLTIQNNKTRTPVDAG